MPDQRNENPMRAVGFWEKVICRVRSPLASVPECAHMTSMAESMKYGYDALGFRLIAQSLIMGVQYTVHAAVEGDIAEFGTQTGRTARAISAAMRLYRAEKALHLFDSFEGLPEATAGPDLENEHVKSGVWGKGALKGIEPEVLRQQCAKQIGLDSVKIYKGWFSDTLPTIPANAKFSMVHVDSDFYSSAYEVLDHLFSHQSFTEGALLYFDDWDCHRASNGHGERRAFREVAEKYKVDAENMGGYAWAGHKFIIHSYSPKKSG